ncbi:hypothetical protein GCT13_43635 [Paraburkholderia sp. CNPSo 3157]|uniref:Uncharacterized protein n=1 Tax=Paraburkholderia franconis TaxID=2654983 RepID=A0A7X1NKC5_9BURK|nr:hypothetical protein [Paraburkholderia franconis]MPW23454.1 hypothetical protein [Paraburkholderia franconis]
MKRILTTVVIAAMLCSPALQAATKDAVPAQSTPKSQAQKPAEFDKDLVKLQQLMSQMQGQMDQIRTTQDPQERQRLLQKHWDTMQSAMNIMHSMWGTGMMGPGMMGHGMMGGAGPGWGHMGGYYSNLTPEQLRQRQYMTDQYLRMQQEMMNNMMWQQRYWMGPPSVSPQ